ncbi:hypothetical protein CSPX01_00916 [Colletotrichum filicis]|nr:hypothetical protein CSPX01_00916 [Colletotrichum filicis]
MDRVEEGRDSWRDAAEKGRKWGANIFAVAEAAGPFGAVIPVFGVATVGSLPARLRGPQAPRGSGDWTVQRMPGFLLGTRILVSFLDQWQQRIRGLSRGWMYSKPGKGISGWEWKAAQEPTAPRRWTTALRRSAVRFGLWAIDATPLLTSSTGPGYLTQHPGSQDTASLNFTSLLTIVIVKVRFIAIWRTTAQKSTYLCSNISSLQRILRFPRFSPETLDMGKEEINAPPHATRAPPPDLFQAHPAFPGMVAELTARIQTSVSARASRPPTSLHLIPPDFSSQQQQRSQDQGPGEDAGKEKSIENGIVSRR